MGENHDWGYYPQLKEFSMQRTIQAFIFRGESHYVAECAGISVVTQGKTLDETVANLREAVALYLEDEEATSNAL